jgi:hypothetical protein
MNKKLPKKSRNFAVSKQNAKSGLLQEVSGSFCNSALVVAYEQKDKAIHRSFSGLQTLCTLGSCSNKTKHFLSIPKERQTLAFQNINLQITPPRLTTEYVLYL